MQQATASSAALSIAPGLIGGMQPRPCDDAESGMPADRQARLAARRAFVALKLSFLYVVDGLPGPSTLRRQVRLAESPNDLWALRAPVFAALAGTDAAQTGRRQLLNRSLDSMFGPTSTSEYGHDTEAWDPVPTGAL